MDNANDQWTQAESPKSKPPHWEREVLEKLALAAITEQSRARRWNVFFKSLLCLYLLALMAIALYPKMKNDMVSDSDHTAVIDLVGPIAEDKEANATDIIDSLRDAVKDTHTKGIILHANSPGGSPVQSSYVFEEIRKIKKEHPTLPIVAVVSDICASGCYYIVAASDKIYVNPSSLVGSIGVLMDGFGFVETMQKLGVERRLLTAGTHKAMLDPFSPPKEDETSYMKGLLNQVHNQFIQAVKTGRGERLREASDTFSGLVWTGEEGIKFGLVDAVGNNDSVARDIIGAKKLVNFSHQAHLLDKLVGKLGVSFGQAMASLLITPVLR